MSSGTPAEAIQALIDGQPPSDTFLRGNIFRVLVSRSIIHAKGADYYAVDSHSQLCFQDSSESLDAKVRSFLIPATPGTLIFTSGHFPADYFATISLDTSGLRAICTERLKDCTMAFGWDATNGRLYVGRVEADATIPEISDRKKLCHYLRTSADFTGFEGVTVPKHQIVFLGGDRPCWSDDLDEAANVLGFLHENTIHLVVQVVASDGTRIKDSWTLDFP